MDKTCNRKDGGLVARRGNVRVTPPAFKCTRLIFPMAEVPGATPYGDHHITTGGAGVNTETKTGHPQRVSPLQRQAHTLGPKPDRMERRGAAQGRPSLRVA